MDMEKAKARLESWYNGEDVDISPELLDCAYKAICFYLEHETVNKLKNGYWMNRSKHNDHLWAECSECGFRIENYKAVETGISSDDYVAVKWNYCPKCGSKMEVKNE